MSELQSLPPLHAAARQALCMFLSDFSPKPSPHLSHLFPSLLCVWCPQLCSPRGLLVPGELEAAAKLGRMQAPTVDSSPHPGALPGGKRDNIGNNTPCLTVPFPPAMPPACVRFCGSQWHELYHVCCYPWTRQALAEPHTSAQARMPGSLGLNPAAAMEKLCDFGQLCRPLCASISLEL